MSGLPMDPGLTPLTVAGIYGVRPNRNFSFPVGKFASVFKLKSVPLYNVHMETQEGLVRTSGFSSFLIARLHLGHSVALM